MSSPKHLHIVGNEIKFIRPFVNYINNNFNSDEHLFLILNSQKERVNDIAGFSNIKIIRPYDSSNGFIRKMILFFKVPMSIMLLFYYFSKSKKIYLHGLFDKKVILFLYIFNKFASKTNWIIWGGGDIDVPTDKENISLWYKIAKKVKGSFSGYITYLPGDYMLAKRLYNAKGEFYESLMYESNVFNYTELKSVNDDVVRIQVGNSADPANNHLEIFDSLQKFKQDNIKVYCILSYGEKPWSNGWTQKVINRGKELFGDKFIPIVDFMDFEIYLEFLSKIDIAIFAHKRQQAMGNTISLLGLGKKVYMRSDVTSWELFSSIGVKAFDVNDISLAGLALNEKENNIETIKNFFSKEKYYQQLKNLFEDY
ncbi:TDP-N-acetylfucosamine:lipid II N-acetylfucosaminyltransferase [Psychromonas aquimarina]|uniref:TDP-N-acetylfucosamine:lipid II N-acetylfucosaminyltransferase n=1 Tax=Psychromonas aquimarina TaxID=444919 RepID=UPI000407DE93|nr:TDP-N-acetylfucosamine:lipid II N-acetylfucosaminyltransferase [Psychromonas aquimarina]